MPTLAKLIIERRAKFDAFDYDLYDGKIDLDVSALHRAIQSTPVLSKVDALAALDQCPLMTQSGHSLGGRLS